MTSNITLDKALEAIDEKSYDQEWFSNLIIDTDDAKAIIMKLVDTQTIEMTKEEFTQFTYYLNNAKLLALLTDNSFGINQEDGESLFNHLTEEDLAQAWLHPETVEVID